MKGFVTWISVGVAVGVVIYESLFGKNMDIVAITAWVETLGVGIARKLDKVRDTIKG